MSVKAARSAYGAKQAQKSRAIHEAKRGKKDKPASELGHKSMSATELDQHFATMGAAASRGLVLSVSLVFVLSQCDLLAYLSRVAVPLVLAVGMYVTALAFWSKRAARQVEQFERERETWELDNYPQGEEAEMVELFEEKGYSQEQAQQVVAILATRKKAFVEIMMVEELGLLPSPSAASIALHSLITLVSTIAAGAVPVLLMGVVSLGAMLALCGVLLFLCGVLLSKTTVDSGALCGLINLGLGAAVLALVSCL